jgi:hypothetical protein
LSPSRGANDLIAAQPAPGIDCPRCKETVKKDRYRVKYVFGAMPQQRQSRNLMRISQESTQPARLGFFVPGESVFTYVAIEINYRRKKP